MIFVNVKEIHITLTTWSNTFDKSIFMGFDYYIFHSSPPFSSQLSQHIDDQQNFVKIVLRKLIKYWKLQLSM